MPELAQPVLLATADLTSLAVADYQVARPIPLVVQTLPDSVLVSDGATGLYGEGTTLAIALNTYRAQLMSYFDWLLVNEAHLNAVRRHHLAWLRARVKRLGVPAGTPGGSPPIPIFSADRDRAAGRTRTFTDADGFLAALEEPR